MQLNDKLKELTETIYNEGVARANEEAKTILENAASESKRIIEEATKEALQIKETAKAEAVKLQDKIQTDTQLAFAKSVSEIQNKISNLITMKVSDFILDNKFAAKIMDMIVDTFKEGKVELSQDLASHLEQTVKGGAGKFFGPGLDVVINQELDFGIRVTPKGSTYFIDFTKESLLKFIEEYLGPITHKVLFK